jgi:hypothetical protein
MGKKIDKINGEENEEITDNFSKKGLSKNDRRNSSKQF